MQLMMNMLYDVANYSPTDNVNGLSVRSKGILEGQCVKSGAHL